VRLREIAWQSVATIVVVLAVILIFGDPGSDGGRTALCFGAAAVVVGVWVAVEFARGRRP